MKKKTYFVLLLGMFFCYGCLESPTGPAGSITWNNALQNSGITSIAINDYDLIAGARGGIVYLSLDNGINWVGIDTLKTVDSIPGANFVLIPSIKLYCNGDIIFAGANNTIKSNIDVSTDGGIKWKDRDTSFHLNVNDFTSSDQTVYAATTKGIYSTTDNGTTWNFVYDGNGNKDESQNVTCIFAKDSYLFASFSDEGFMRSDDNGKSWTQLNNELTNRGVSSLAAIGSNIFASAFQFPGDSSGGIYLSTNDGTSWETVNNGLTNHMVNFIYANGNNLFAGTNEYLFYSNSLGKSWSVLDSSFVNCLTVYGSNALAGTGKGIKRIPF
jgi:photosystem II stability/assembly factor-like uncharacterized protein